MADHVAVILKHRIPTAIRSFEIRKEAEDVCELTLEDKKVDRSSAK